MAAPAPTRDELEEFLVVETERKQFEREARTLLKRSKALAGRFRAYLAEIGKTSVKRQGHRLQLIDGRVYVAWKDAFIAECGEEKARDIEAETPASQQLLVTAEP